MTIDQAFAGMPATVHVGSDSYGATVVFAGRGKVVVRMDDAVQVGDYFGAQKWIHTPSAEGREDTFVLRTVRGQKVWAEEGKKVAGSAKLTLGEKHSHRDPSF